MNEATDRKLQQQVLLGRRVEHDRLMLADEVLRAALEGTRHLTAGERTALQASPLTLRRFHALSRERAAAAQQWQRSSGMLRAAAGSAPLDSIDTDDGYWTLHFVAQDGLWRIILALDAGAPMAQALVQNAPALRVVDGAGNVVLQGVLDDDGECEAAWPADTAPAEYFQQHGAVFAVEPVR